MLAVEAGVEHTWQGRRRPRLQEAGRQGRPMIRRLGLVANDDDLAGSAFLAQGLGGAGGGQAAAHQQEIGMLLRPRLMLRFIRHLAHRLLPRQNRGWTRPLT
jgi:hypothetical protein